MAWRPARSPAWLGGCEGPGAGLGSWARAVGDLGALTMEWSRRCRGGVVATSTRVEKLEGGLEGGLEKPEGLGHESVSAIPY